MSLHEPPLSEEHEAAGADFTDFGGWRMPVSFDSIRQEHLAVRDSVGIFDVSHMSEVAVSGPDATELMNRLTTNDVTDLSAGDAQYSCILDEDGVIIDDTVVYRYPDRDEYLFVPNAGNGEAMTARWTDFADEFGFSVTVEDRTHDLGLVAVQGPIAVETVDAVADATVDSIDRFTWERAEIAGVTCSVARTGYTGEDGFEIFFDADDSAAVWGAFDDVQPCGLGARDTLRLEAGLLLSGQDFDPEDEPRTPLEARLGFVVDLDGEFVGRDALADQQQEGVDEALVGLRIDGRAIARHGYPILREGDRVGQVTSGTMSPEFDVPIALGYVDADLASPGTAVEVGVRERTVDATVIEHDFLDSLDVTDEPERN